MSAGVLIAKLAKVKQNGPGRWLACCPAHEDRTPSMTVREMDDGRVLVHCFAGCGIEQILGAVGLDFGALFPPKLIAERVPPIRRPFNAHDVLEAVASEAALVAVAAANIGEGVELSPGERSRVTVAAGRLEEARRLANG